MKQKENRKEIERTEKNEIEVGNKKRAHGRERVKEGGKYLSPIK